MTDADIVMHAISRDHKLREDCVDCRQLPFVHARLAAARGEPPEPSEECWTCGQPCGHLSDAPISARGEPQIDVERLARAMTNVYEQDLFPIKSDDWRYDASLIAAEYAALATPTTPEPDQ